MVTRESVPSFITSLDRSRYNLFMDPYQPPDLAQLTQRGHRYARRQEYAKAIEAFTGAIDLDPTDADAKKLIKGYKLLLEEGYISLQAESHPCEFRKVELKVLKK